MHAQSSARWPSSRVTEFFADKKRQFRTEVRIRTDGPDFSLSFFSPYAAQAEKYAAEMRAGQPGALHRQGQAVPPHLAARAAPRLCSVEDDEAASLPRLLPVYPLTAPALRLGPHPGHRHRPRPGHRGDRRADPRAAPRARRVDIMTALRLAHRPDDYAQVGAAQKRFRFEEALVLQLVLAGDARRPRSGPWAPGPGEAAGSCCGLRRPAALPAHRRAARDRRPRRGGAGPRPPDEPAPPGRGRLGQDARRPARDAAGRRLRRARPRCSRPPRCSPSSTTARSPPCSATSRRAACSAGPTDGTSVVCLTGLDGQDCPPGGACCRWRPARRGS